MSSIMLKMVRKTEPALVLPSCDLESQLRIVCEKYIGPHAQIATDLVDSLLPGSSGSIPAHHASTSSQGHFNIFFS